MDPRCNAVVKHWTRPISHVHTVHLRP